jgi:hypothetical protein
LPKTISSLFQTTAFVLHFLIAALLHFLIAAPDDCRRTDVEAPPPAARHFSRKISTGTSKAHSLTKERLEIVESLNDWAEEALLPLLKDPNTNWQPQVRRQRWFCPGAQRSDSIESSLQSAILRATHFNNEKCHPACHMVYGGGIVHVQAAEEGQMIPTVGILSVGDTHVL